MCVGLEVGGPLQVSVMFMLKGEIYMGLEVLFVLKGEIHMGFVDTAGKLWLLVIGSSTYFECDLF